MAVLNILVEKHNQGNTVNLCPSGFITLTFYRKFCILLCTVSMFFFVSKQKKNDQLDQH